MSASRVWLDITWKYRLVFKIDEGNDVSVSGGDRLPLRVVAAASKRKHLPGKYKYKYCTWVSFR